VEFRTEKLLGEEFRKIQPKLMMFAKAKDPVNMVRSDFASAVRVGDEAGEEPVEEREHALPGSGKPEAKATDMRRQDVSVKASVFVMRVAPDAATPGLEITGTSRDGTLLSATVAMRDLPGLAEAPQV
jgi:hypothetical protein